MSVAWSPNAFGCGTSCANESHFATQLETTPKKVCEKFNLHPILAVQWPKRSCPMEKVNRNRRHPDGLLREEERESAMRSAGKRLHWSWVFMLAFVFVGCEYEDPFSKPYRPPRIKTQASKKKLAISNKIMPFVYVPVKKRDPFRPPYLTQTTKRTTESQTKTTPIVRPRIRRKPQTELEKYELDQITVVATITGVANPIAMVEGPDGQGFVVRRGTSIGRNGGRVARIYSTGIVISEVSRDNAGRRIVSRVMIRIKGKKGSKSQGNVKIGGRELRLDSSGQPQFRSIKRRTDRLFRRRGVGAQ